MKYCTRDGGRFEVNTGQDRFVKKMYDCLPGRLVMKLLTGRGLSKAVGAFLNTRLSKCFIKPFVKKHHMDLNIYEQREFKSYNDFFSRKIRPELRPIEKDPQVLISPCDGKLSVYPVDNHSLFKIKNSTYSLLSLLQSKKLTMKYNKGTLVLIRLTVDDYHRYCYVESGKKTRNYRISGCLHTVNPAAVEQVPVYKENTREFTIIRTEGFGDIIQMEVGAMMVGKISNYHPAAKVTRGQEKGCFEFGGSTVLLLFEKDKVSMDEDLVLNTKEGYETLVSMGMRIGKKAQTQS